MLLPFPTLCRHVYNQISLCLDGKIESSSLETLQSEDSSRKVSYGNA